MLKSAKNNKSVSDGLPVEFFKCANVSEIVIDPVTDQSSCVKFNVLADHILLLFNQCFLKDIYPSFWN